MSGDAVMMMATSSGPQSEFPGRTLPMLQSVLRKLSAKAGLAVFTGFLLTWLAPFGTARIETFSRTGFWVGMMVAWIALAFLAHLAVERLPVSLLPQRVRILLKIALPLGPMTVVVALASNRLMGWTPSPLEIAELFVQVVLLCLLFEAFSRAMDEDDRVGRTAPSPEAPVAFTPAAPAAPTETGPIAPPAESAAPAAANDETAVADAGSASPRPSEPPRLAERLPFHLRGPILCLQMEDHYVRIHTAQGSTLALMRMGDAIAELDGAEGLRVHRSWWVAAEVCRDVQRSARATRISIAGGPVVPVSRPYVEAVTSLAGRLAA